MNKKTREIIEVSRELIEVTKKANSCGVIGVTDNSAQVYTEEGFKRVALESPHMPRLIIRQGREYPYKYSVEVEELTFIHISETPIYPADEVEAENESTR